MFLIKKNLWLQLKYCCLDGIVIDNPILPLPPNVSFHNANGIINMDMHIGCITIDTHTMINYIHLNVMKAVENNVLNDHLDKIQNG